jgi:nicotinamidase/pyrazinamidase
MGLATDYCVKFTALDARNLGFETFLITDGCRGVDLNPGDVDSAIEEMRAAGVIPVSRANF